MPNHSKLAVFLGFLLCGPWAEPPGAVAASSPSPPQLAGRFSRVFWYERGLEHGNPRYDGRFRVNAPETVLHPTFGKRIEARENGMMLIRAEEDLSLLTGAALYLELWGGHPGTANKRVTINGRGSYELTRVGTEENNCTYSYPFVPLPITDLVNGYNAIQFACDRGTTFWGHFIVDNACLCLELTNGHPALAQAGLGEFWSSVKATEIPDREIIQLALEAPAESLDRIAAVDFQGRYTGYDENGDGQNTDWHGFTKARKPVAILGTATAPPFEIAWDTRLLPSQSGVAARAVVHFKGQTNLVYATGFARGLTIAERARSQVRLFGASNVPHPFWSRAGNKSRCTIDLDLDPARIEQAELHVVTWTGGSGNVKDYFTLNGRPFPVAEGARHEVIYSKLPVEPPLLKRGPNQIELLSDTDHHGIEVFLPGPALMVRCKR